MKLNLHRWLLLLLPLGLALGARGQTTLKTENFDTDGEGIRYTSNAATINSQLAFDGSLGHYFIRTNTNPVQYAGTIRFGTAARPATLGSASGSFWAGEGVRDYDFYSERPSARADAGTVALNSTAVSGYSDLKVSVRLADARGSGYAFYSGVSTVENTDKIRIEYSMDGGTWKTVGLFRGDSPNANTTSNMRAANPSTEAVISGGSILTNAFQTFTYSIPETGNGVQVRVVMDTQGGSKELAFDDISVIGTVSATPAPALAGIESSSVAYTEGQAAKQVTSALTVSGTVTRAIVSFASGFRSGQDVLDATVSGGVTKAYDGTTGTLTLTGSAAASVYQTILQSVTYVNSNTTSATGGIRTVQFVAYNTTTPSNAQTRNVEVTAILGGPATLPYTEDFEDDGEGVRYATNTFSNSANFQGWFRTNLNPVTNYTTVTFGNVSGSNYWYGEGTKNASNPDPAKIGYLETQTINASGYRNLNYQVRLATGQTGSSSNFETDDFFKVYYRVSGGSWMLFGAFYGNGTGLQRDTNADGVADGVTLTTTLTAIDFALPPTVTGTVDFRTELSSDAQEEVAFDRIYVTGTPPTTVNSIVRASANPTNAATVNYTVTFGAAVTGLTASNFSLSTTGTVSGATVGTPTVGTGNTWTVPVNTGTGSGTLTLNLANDTNLSSGISTTLPFAGETYTIDKLAPSVGITSSAGSSGSTTGTTPIPFTVTFSETVTGFVQGDLSVTGGSITGFTAVSGTTYTFNVTPSGSGSNVTVNVAANTAQDAAGNGNTAASQFSITYQQPLVATSQSVTVQLDASGNGTLAASSVNNNSTGPGTLTYTIQKIVFGRTTENNTLTLTTPNAANFTAIRFASYGTPTNDPNGNYVKGSCDAANSVATATNSFVNRSTGSMDATNGNSGNNNPTLGDPCSGTPKALAVQAAYSADAASLTYNCNEAGKTQYVLLTVSNGSTSSTSVARVTVNAPPVATITSVSPSPAPRGATVTVSGTNLSGIGSTITVNGATAAVSGLSASSFTFVVPTGATTGAGNLTVTAPCSQTLTPAFTVQAQTATPALTTPTSGSTTNGTPVFAGTSAPNALIRFYLNGQDVGTTTANGSGNFGVLVGTTLPSGAYTLYVTALVSGQSVSNNSATINFTVDSTQPVPTVSTTSPSPTSTAPIPFRVTFSEAVTGFTQSSLTVSNGFVAGFSGSGTTYNLTITPSGTGTVTVSVLASSGAVDGVGNPNEASNSVSVQYNQPVTNTPVLTAPANGSFVRTNQPEYRGTTVSGAYIFIYRATGSGSFALVDTTIANGLGNFHKFSTDVLADGTYRAYVTATSSGQATSANSNTNTFTVDTTQPTVTLSSGTVVNGGVTSTSPVNFTATFSEPVTNFTSIGILVSGGTVTSGPTAGSGNTYTFQVTPSGAGTVVVQILPGAAKDQAGNNSSSSTAYSFTYNLPTATVTAVTGTTPSPTATAQVSYTVTFSTSVSGLGTSNFNLTTTGSVSGASVFSVSGSGTTYTVLVNTGTGDGTLRLNVNNSTGVTPTISNVPYTSGTTYTITKSFAAAPTLRIQAAGSASGNGDVTAFVDLVQVLNASNGSAVANGLQNNSFESNNVPASNFKKTPDGVVASPWSFTGLAGVTRNGSAFGSTAYDGDAVALIQSAGDNNASISQNLAVPTGSYQINFQASQRNYTSKDQRLNVFVNDVFVGNIQPNNNTPPTYDPFTSATFTVTAPALVATVSTTSASPTSTSPIPFSVSFSQSVGTTFTASDVTVTGGTLTSGSFSGSGAGPYTFTVTPSGAGTVTVSLAANVANDANNTGNSASNSVSVQFQAPTITVAPATVPNGTQGTAYPTQTFSATGGSGTYTFSFTGTLPTGLTLTGNTLSGTPTAAGTYNFTVTARDNSAAPGPYSGSQAYTVTIAAPAVTSVGWNGSQSTDWFTAANWTPNTVPDATIDAIIPTAPSGNRFPVITANASQANARNVSIASGASLSMSANTLIIAANLTNNGTFNGSTGSGSTATGGTVVVGGSAAAALNGGGSTRFWNLTVGSNGSQNNNVNATSVQRLLTLNGTLATGTNPFTLVSDATATAMVVNNGSAVVTGNVTVQRYIDPTLNPNLGYRHVSAAVSGATIGSLTTNSYSPVVNPAYNGSATPLTTRPFPTVYGYDQSRLATTTNNLNIFDKGWFSPSATSDPLPVGLGRTVLIAANQTWNFTGTLNNGDQTLTLARNAGATAANSGLHMVGNPYPSPLDWGQVAAGDRNNLDNVIYVYRSTNPANPYVGAYGSYNNGTFTGSLTSTVLAQGQGFFVRVTQGTTSGSLTFRNTQRVSTYQTPTYGRTAETRPFVRLALQGVGSSDVDDAVVYFEQGATAGHDGEYDAEKLSNPSGLNVSTTISVTERMAINGLNPLGTSQLVVPVAVGVPAVGSYTLKAAELLNLGSTPTYLRDRQTGAVIDLARQASYQFSVSDASALITSRFELVFSPQAPLATATAALAAQVALYPNPTTGSAFVELPAQLGRSAVTATLVDAVGRQVRTVSLPAQGAVAHTLDLRELPSGVYLLRLSTSAGTIVKKLTVE